MKSADLKAPPTATYLCRLDELTVGQAARADLDGTIVAVVRTADDTVHAVNDTCTHANVSLAEGEVDGCTLECWLHGSRFHLRSGLPLSLPATVPVAVYPVHVIDGAVYVDVTTAKEH